ncbi:hypothetical protein [Marinoscillum sp.]|uniref:hypothetical protein n=1 Tax=Marinoscillum sp. TaxID=2024838 RepID=UPI003BA9E113
MRITLTLVLVLTLSELSAQSTDIPLNSWAYPVLDEWDVKSESGVFTEIKPISRRYFAEKLKETSWVETKADLFDKQYVLQETHEFQDSVAALPNPLFNTFFKYPADFYSYSDKDFDLHVNPVVVLGAAKDQQGRLDELLFENYRGLELRGTIDDKVSFYTMLTENQARYADYVQDVTDTTIAVPYEGFWKQYETTGVDFLRAQAYIDINATKHISAQFGYGKHFIGDGRRSLILSDVGNNYPYLRLNTRIWKIQYTNIFAQLVGETQGGDFGLLGTGSFTKKYLANHHLSVKVLPNLTVGLFESVIYGDSTQNLKVEYLNPIIFYRSLEQQDGSSDNVLLGLDFKWNLFHTMSLYGQLVIDELIVSEAFGDSGWWGNKQAFQLGAKYFDVLGIQDLNAQVELNRVRPYVYTHENNFTSYSHYNMALAHPLGANFQEVLLSLNYRPFTKWRVSADVLLASYGDDLGSASYGRDIMKSYNRRPSDYGVDLLQGNKTDLTMIQGKVSYQFWHNAMIDLDAIYRTETSETTSKENVILGATLRWNFPARSYLF